MTADILKCHVCRANIPINNNIDYVTCEYCGTQMKLGKDFQDRQQKIIAYNRGNAFREQGDYDGALAEFERVVHMDDTDAEAHWGCFLSRFGIEYVEDPDTLEYIPTCHRASFDSVENDLDYKAALKYSTGLNRRQYQKEGLKITNVLKGVLATAQESEPYDIFICYKQSEADGSATADSRYAEDLYRYLTSQNYRVFFVRESLKDKPGTEYEPFIFAALNSAKIMLVVGTSTEHLESAWVKNEWNRFLALKRKNNEKIIIPCFRDMRAEDLPAELYPFQAYDMGDISFLSNLLRALNKQQSHTVNTKTADSERQDIKQNINNLIVRMKEFHRQGNYIQAIKYSNQILDIDFTNWEAHYIQLLSQYRASSLSELNISNGSLSDDPTYSSLMKNAPDSIKESLKEKDAELKEKYRNAQVMFSYQKQWKELEKYWDGYDAFNYKRRNLCIFLALVSCIFSLRIYGFAISYVLLTLTKIFIFANVYRFALPVIYSSFFSASAQWSDDVRFTNKCLMKTKLYLGAGAVIGWGIGYNLFCYGLQSAWMANTDSTKQLFFVLAGEPVGFIIGCTVSCIICYLRFIFAKKP